jgi:peptidyl-tRNA hydrolase, PTH1 family
LETDDFPRLRLGIGPKKYDAADFVLSRFSKTELKALNEIAPTIIQTVDTFVKNGIEQAMIICNSSFK